MSGKHWVWLKKDKEIETHFLARELNFKLTAQRTWLVNGYYITGTGRWRKKSKFTWYAYSELDILLDKLFNKE